MRVQLWGLVPLCWLLLAAAPAQQPLPPEQLLLDQCQTFGDELLPRLLSRTPWDIPELLRLASPELLAAASAEEIETIFSGLSEQMGALSEPAEARLEVAIRRSGERRTTTCTYQTAGQFEIGPGAVILQGILHDGRWEIAALRVTASPLGQPST